MCDALWWNVTPHLLVWSRSTGYRNIFERKAHLSLIVACDVAITACSCHVLVPIRQELTHLKILLVRILAPSLVRVPKFGMTELVDASTFEKLTGARRLFPHSETIPYALME